MLNRSLRFACFALVLGFCNGASAQATTFTYQGQLQNAGQPYTGLVELQFSLYEEEIGGTPLAAVVHSEVAVEDGLFQVGLDFGQPTGFWSRRTLYLAVTVDGTTLSPRQAITPVPRSRSADFAEDGLWPFRFDAALNAVYPSAGNVGIGVEPPGFPLHVAGRASLGEPANTAPGGNAFVAGGEPGSPNAAEGNTSAVLGGVANVSSGTDSVVAGGGGNVASGRGSFIAGGNTNRASNIGAVVLGGQFNSASGELSTVLGNTSAATALLSFAAGDGARANHSESFVWNGSAGFGLEVFESTDDYQFLVNPANGMGVRTNQPLAPFHVLGDTPSASAPFWQVTVEGADTNGAQGTGAGISFLGNDGAGVQRIWGWIENVKENNTSGNTRSRMSFYTRGASGLPSERMRIQSNGEILNSFGTWSVLSDRRLKQDIEPVSDALDTLLALQGVWFRYRENMAPFGDARPRMGFVAQQVEQVLPGWVSESGGGYKRITPIGFRALAVEAIRELQQRTAAENERLRDENARLTTRLAAVEAKTGHLETLAARNADLEARLASLEVMLSDRALASGGAR